jgi:hypothetical protein
MWWNVCEVDGSYSLQMRSIEKVEMCGCEGGGATDVVGWDLVILERELRVRFE